MKRCRIHFTLEELKMNSLSLEDIATATKVSLPLSSTPFLQWVVVPLARTTGKTCMLAHWQAQLVTCRLASNDFVTNLQQKAGVITAEIASDKPVKDPDSAHIQTKRFVQHHIFSLRTGTSQYLC